LLISTPLFLVTATVAAPVECMGALGVTRRIIPVLGGRFEGDRLSGILLPGGTDVQRARPDGVVELNIRVILQTDEGDCVFFNGSGIRYATPEITARLATGENLDPSEYYFREAITFETAVPRLAWLNSLIAIGTGRRSIDAVELEVYSIA
jgi:hypothetical protein